MKRVKQIRSSLFILCAGILLFAASCSKENHQLISVSDIHFNPFQDSLTVAKLAKSPSKSWDGIFAQMQNKNLPEYNEECNPVLFDLLLKAMSEKKEGISAVLFTGDVLCHDFNDLYKKFTGRDDEKSRDAFIYKTMAYVSSKMKHRLDEIPIYFALGNNDSYRGDYALEDEGEFLKSTCDLFYHNWIHRQATGDEYPEFRDSYSQHGYYNVENPILDKGRIIGLNTNFFSVNNSDSIWEKSPAAVELNWLEQQLKRAETNGDKVWLLLHIPPGVNVYSTEHKSKANDLQVYLQWKAPYNQSYLSLVKRYHRNITASFAGHTHMDDFRLIYDKASDKQEALDFIHITPSVSPVFGNNPVFQILSIDANTSSLSDAVTFHVDLSAEQATFNEEYTYTSTYDLAPNVSGLDQVYPKFLSNVDYRNIYISYYPSDSKATGINKEWQWYWTGIGNLTASDYKQAYESLQVEKK